MIPSKYWHEGRVRPEALSELPGPFTVSELASALDCSARYVLKCIDAGVIKAGRVGREYRVSKGEAAKMASAVLGA